MVDGAIFYVEMLFVFTRFIMIRQHIKCEIVLSCLYHYQLRVDQFSFTTVNVICLPTEHQGVHKNSFEMSVHSRIELEFGNVGFWGEGKTGEPGEKPLRSEWRTNNKLNPHMTPGPGIKPGPHWWEASALPTASSVLPCAIPASYWKRRFHSENDSNVFRPQYAREILKRSLTSTAKPNLHTNRSSKRSLLRTIFKPEGFENTEFSFWCEQKAFW